MQKRFFDLKTWFMGEKVFWRENIKNSQIPTRENIFTLIWCESVFHVWWHFFAVKAWSHVKQVFLFLASFPNAFFCNQFRLFPGLPCTNKVTFWDRRSWYWVIMRQIMGQNKVTFWDRRSWYWVITRWIMRQKKVTFWDKRSWLMVTTRRILGLNKVIFWDRRSQFWVLTRWIMGHSNVTF